MNIVKGIVSAVYTEEKKLSVILPEYDNLTTKPFRLYGTLDIEEFAVNDFVLVVIFNNDFNDGIVLSGVLSGAIGDFTLGRMTVN